MRRLLTRLAVAVRFAFAAPHVLDPARNVTLVEHAGAPGTVLRSTPIDLDEALRSDGTVPIKIISPGWGSKGYYSAELLERDGPAAFPKGTHMYLDHPSMTEAMDRPERSVRDLAAVLATGARWVPDHPKGPGLYAEAEVLDTFRPVINELGPHIGVSIRAPGTGRNGTAEGRTGTIVESISTAHSVDFVTKAGRGGEVLALLESAGIELEEAGVVAAWFESRIHSDFTVRADDLYGDGRLTLDERKAMSSGIGAALDAFRAVVEAEAPQLYERGRWDEPAASTNPTTVTTEESSMQLTDKEKTELTESVTAGVLVALEKKGITATEAAAPAAGDDEAATKLAAVEAENASLKEAAAIASARPLVESLAKDACKGMPEITRLRVIEAAATNPKLVDGKVDEAALKEAVEAEAKRQLEYLESVGVKVGGGEVAGLGPGATTLVEGDTKPADDKVLEESVRGVFGLTKPA